MDSKLICIFCVAFFGTVSADTTVPHDFQAGQPARASEVNENFDTLESAIDQNAADIDELQAADLEANLIASDARRASSRLYADVDRLSKALNLTCGQFTTDNLYACTQVTTGNATVFSFSTTVLQYQSAFTDVIGSFSGPADIYPSGRVIVMVQDVTDTHSAAFGGTVNFFRPFEPADSVSRLVDDCDNPTIGMVAKGTETYALSRWRVNNGGFYAVGLTESAPNSGSYDYIPTGEVDVTGQTVGVVKNITFPYNPESIVWCETSSSVTGVYSVYDLVPFSSNLDGPDFLPPYTFQ